MVSTADGDSAAHREKEKMMTSLILIVFGWVTLGIICNVIFAYTDKDSGPFTLEDLGTWLSVILFAPLIAVIGPIFAAFTWYEKNKDLELFGSKAKRQKRPAKLKKSEAAHVSETYELGTWR